MPKPPAQPKIYHIVHVDRLASIIADGRLWSDAVVVGRGHVGTTIGMGGISYANHPELTYRGGQGPIVHLEADLYEVVAWADAKGRRWAFTLSNAGALYTQSRARLDQLDQVNWPAVAATDFRAADIKEGKQAEFLLHHDFPWELIRRIGVYSAAIAQQATDAMNGAVHRPVVEIRKGWYF